MKEVGLRKRGATATKTSEPFLSARTTTRSPTPSPTCPGPECSTARGSGKLFSPADKAARGPCSPWSWGGRNDSLQKSSAKSGSAPYAATFQPTAKRPRPRQPLPGFLPNHRRSGLGYGNNRRGYLTLDPRQTGDFPAADGAAMAGLILVALEPFQDIIGPREPNILRRRRSEARAHPGTT